MENVTSKEHITLALDDFEESYKKELDEDKIVNYMTAFGFIIFSGREKTIEPAGEVMGIAVGMLLGSNEQERAEIRKTIDKAYKIRNARVHGNIKKIYERGLSNVRQVSLDTEECLRRTLRKFTEE